MYEAFVELCFGVETRRELLKWGFYNYDKKFYYYNYWITKNCFYISTSINKADWGGDFVYRYNKLNNQVDLFEVIDGVRLYKVRNSADLDIEDYRSLVYESDCNDLIKDFNIFIKCEEFSILYGDIYYNYKLVGDDYKVTYSYVEEKEDDCGY